MGQKKQEEPQKASQQIGKISEAFSELKSKSEILEPDPAIVLLDIPRGTRKPIDLQAFVDTWFKPAFKIFEKKDFDETANDGEPLKFLKTVLFYFLQDPKFYKSPLIQVGPSFPEPSLSKGLLIVGGYGCGKTAVIKTLHRIFERAQIEPYIAVKNVDGDLDLLRKYSLRFGYYTANGVKQDFETCPKENEGLFWMEHNGGLKYYDDMTAEETVSKFGRTEIFKSILENRYNSGARTMLSLNYNEADPTIESTLNLFGNKYGARVYDRVFEMFNVISLTGKSLRK